MRSIDGSKRCCWRDQTHELPALPRSDCWTPAALSDVRSQVRDQHRSVASPSHDLHDVHAVSLGGRVGAEDVRGGIIQRRVGSPARLDSPTRTTTYTSRATMPTSKRSGMMKRFAASSRLNSNPKKSVKRTEPECTSPRSSRASMRRTASNSFRSWLSVASGGRPGPMSHGGGRRTVCLRERPSRS